MLDSMLETVLVALAWLIQQIQPLVVPVCFVVAWLLLLLVAWSVVSFLRDGLSRARTMHEIPCSRCQYFTENYYLKCPVRPGIALSEAAINCTDYKESLGFYS